MLTLCPPFAEAFRPRKHFGWTAGHSQLSYLWTWSWRKSCPVCEMPETWMGFRLALQTPFSISCTPPLLFTNCFCRLHSSDSCIRNFPCGKSDVRLMCCAGAPPNRRKRMVTLKTGMFWRRAFFAPLPVVDSKCWGDWFWCISISKLWNWIPTSMEYFRNEYTS